MGAIDSPWPLCYGLLHPNRALKILFP